MGVNLGTTIWLKTAAWLSILGNGLLVVTGGAVRLTGSGLGCPTWPHCNPGSFTPHGALTYHSAIEFGNRLLSFALAAIAIFTFIAAWQSGRKQLCILALILGLAIPAQAVIGGITVLTDLNPWLVALHLLASMGLVSLGVVFLDNEVIDAPGPDRAVRRSGPCSMRVRLTRSGARSRTPGRRPRRRPPASRSSSP